MRKTDETREYSMIWASDGVEDIIITELKEMFDAGDKVLENATEESLDELSRTSNAMLKSIISYAKMCTMIAAVASVVEEKLNESED